MPRRQTSTPLLLSGEARPSRGPPGTQPMVARGLGRSPTSRSQGNQDETAIRLKQRLHQQRGIPRFTIIPPVWNKAVDTHDIFRRIWQEAANRLRAARVIAVVGFSFVPTDLYAQSLFRIALGERSRLKRLIIANPSHDARVRIRQVFDIPLLEKGVLLRQYESFRDLVDALPEALD